MTLKSRFYATAAILIALVSSASAQTSTPTKTETTIYPPTNIAAGQGLLYFPQGGNSSLYAVPVAEDPNLTAAINSQTTAVVAALNNLSIANNSGSGTFVVNCPSSSPSASPGGCYGTNTRTGITYYSAFPRANGQMQTWTQITNALPSVETSVCSGYALNNPNNMTPVTMISYRPGQTFLSAENYGFFATYKGVRLFPEDPAAPSASLPNGCSFTCGNNGQWSSPTMVWPYGAVFTNAGLPPSSGYIDYINYTQCITPTGASVGQSQ